MFSSLIWNICQQDFLPISRGVWHTCAIYSFTQCYYENNAADENADNDIFVIFFHEIISLLKPV